MKTYIVRYYDREMLIRRMGGVWESESHMLNYMMRQGFKVIEYWELEE